MISKGYDVQNRFYTIISNILGILLIIGGVIHWLIIFGVLHERAPYGITLYFHSLAVLDILAGVGLIRQYRWAYLLVAYIGVTQIAAHGYMSVLDIHHQYGSGITTIERGVDILIALTFIGFAWYAIHHKTS